jgi:hypothetical protein
MMPFAPGRFSTTKVWPRRSVSFAAMMRATTSGPPGPAGTTMRTVWVG